MGKPKTQKLPFENNQEYKYFTPPDTEDIKALRGWNPQSDPTRPYQFARQRRDVLNLYNNPLGAYTTPELREQMTRSALGELGQQEGQAAREEQYDFNNQKLGQLSTLAALTKPELQQTKSYGFNSGQQQGSGTLGSVIGAGASIAVAF